MDRTTDNSEVISTLNELVEISRDGEKGFQETAENVQNRRLKTLLEEASMRCAQGARELEEKIIDLGGEPAQGGSMSGAMHRAWTEIKSTVTGMDERAILEELERGEDVAKEAYEAALRTPLPSDVKSLVERQYQGVVANHDRVREMRNAA